MSYNLIEVTEPADWVAYHAIRRQELFEARGRLGIYSENYPDEYTANQHHYLLKFGDTALGTTRLELRDADMGIFRLVAITATEQGKGHGRVLGAMVEQRALGFGLTTVLVNAAPTAIGYYQATGWHPFTWDASELVGIAADCVQMRKHL